MARIADYRFDDAPRSGIATDSAGPGDDTGKFAGDARTDGAGSALFDGRGDYMQVAAGPQFALKQGTIAMEFVQKTASAGDGPSGKNAAQTLFSVDALNFRNGGDLTIYIRSDGQIQVRHQTSNTHHYYTGGKVVPGEPVSMAYSWGPTGSVLTVNGEVVAKGDVAHFMSGGENPVVIGASQAHSDPGAANNLQGFFNGSVQRVTIYDEPMAISGPLSCFVAGTPILTEGGWMPVERIVPGQRVLTLRDGPVAVQSILRTHLGGPELHARPALRPVVIPAGRLGLTSQIRLSRQHGILVLADGAPALIRAGHLADFTLFGARIARSMRKVSYLHIDLGAHSLVLAAGLRAETFLPEGGDHPPVHPYLRRSEVASLVRRGAITPPGDARRDPAPWPRMMRGEPELR